MNGDNDSLIREPSVWRNTIRSFHAGMCERRVEKVLDLGQDVFHKSLHTGVFLTHSSRGVGRKECLPCRLNILYVEDQPDDVALFQYVLRRARPTVRSVGNGAEAIQYLDGTNGFGDRSRYPIPDVIFLDWEMPVMNGREYLKWHVNSAHHQIPVVALIGCGFDKELADVKAMGAYRAVIKPNSVQTLSISVLEILGTVTNHVERSPKLRIRLDSDASQSTLHG